MVSKRRSIGALAIGMLVIAVMASLASAASKPPKFLDCISGDTAATKASLGLGGDGNCSASPSASSTGNSGMDSNIALATSADGKSVYTVSYSDDAVVELKRSKQTGKLSYQGCISGSEELGPSGSSACKLIPSHTANGELSGLDRPRGVVVSRDGKSVYVAGGAGDDAAVDIFKRARDTGKLRYASCISGNSDIGPASGGGSGACDLIPHATSGGTDSGLDSPRDLIVSSNGKDLYGVAGGDSALFRFKRSSDGALTWKDCISGSSTALAAHACKPLPVANPDGVATALNSPEYAVLSADQRNVYVSARGSDAFSTFKRDRHTGKLSFQRCLTGNTAVGPGGGGGSGACTLAPTATADGHASGFDSPYAMGVSGDGKSLYAAISNDAAVTTFKRSKKTGKLSFNGCITGSADVGPVGGGGTGACKAIPDISGNGQATGLGSPVGLAVRGDKVVALANFDDAVAGFKRSKKTGKLAYRGCLSDDSDVSPACKLTPHANSDAGLQGATQIVFGGSDLYVSAAGNSAVTHVAP